MPMEHKRIAFIGGGNMASSIIGGLLKQNYPAELICASDPDQTTRLRLQDSLGIDTFERNVDAVADAEVVVLAVKPQVLADVCDALLAELGQPGERLFISIAAGITVERLQQCLKGAPRVVRVMPNTPALVSLGMSGLYAKPGVRDSDKLFCTELMRAVGEAVWVDDEDGINKVIAAAGSAPAYFFLFMEAIQNSAIEMGFDAETARLLVAQTALGSATMVMERDLPLSTLREQVTSKGGTTAEAIRTFEEGQLRELVDAAMKAAVARAKEMESLF